MSQSDAHRNLVTQVAKALESRYPRISIITDVQRVPGDAVPPIIDGYRPDVYARRMSANDLVIAEAKTDDDIDNTHTHNQIISFLTYLERSGSGFFVLSVTGYGANRAKTLLRFIYRDTLVTSTDLAVFDGCDFWLLDPTGGIVWRLS